MEIIGSDGLNIEVRARKQRALLAVLLLHANEWLTTERLVDALWDCPPSSAAGNLKTYVWTLRRRLTDGGNPGSRIETRPSSYRIVATHQELDMFEFEDLLSRGRGLRAAGELTAAVRCLGRALELWSEQPLPDVPPAVSAAQVARLTELRLGAAEELIEARLPMGHHIEAAAEARSLLAEYPFRERLWGQLMLALYRSGRQADALNAYHQARGLLENELAVLPGPALENLHLAILRGDPNLLETSGDPVPQGMGNGSRRTVADRRTMAIPHASEHTAHMSESNPSEITHLELRNDSGQIAHAVRHGRSVAVTDNGTPVGHLRPLRGRTFVPRAQVMTAFATAPALDSERFRRDVDTVADPDATRP